MQMNKKYKKWWNKMLVIYKWYEKEYLEKEIKWSLIANKVEEKINISATKKDVAKNVIA